MQCKANVQPSTSAKECVWTRFFTPERLAHLLKANTLGFLAVLASVVVSVSILVRLPATLNFDVASTRYLQKANSKFLNAAAAWATFMGNGTTLIIVIVAVTIIAAVNKQWNAAMFMGLTLCCLPFNVIMKSLFLRKRPAEDQVRVAPGPRWGTSYPSGHSMCSTVVYGFLAFLLYLHMTTPFWRYLLIVPFAILPLFVATSRIYVGAHWTSDVIGGLAAGMILLVILAVLYPV